MVILYLAAYVVLAFCLVFGLSAMVHDMFTQPSLKKSVHASEFLLSYAQIAYLERGIWGQTFHNPDPVNGRSCECDHCLYGNLPHPVINVGPYIRSVNNIVPPQWTDTENPKDDD